MAPNKTAFRWTLEEEAWLLARVIDDAGRSKKNGKQAQWQKSIVADFKKTFPCLPRSKVSGAVETEAELMQRWNNNSWRIRRWIGNHQEDILRKDADNEPQNLRKRLAPKRAKNFRSKKVRDMAKAHHPDLKAKWTDLHQQFKDGKISKSEMFAEYNNAVTVLLEDEHWKTHYTAMAGRQEPTQKPSASTETNACGDLNVAELQIVQYIPSLSMSTATEANAVRAQYNEPEAHLEHDERQADFDDSHRGVRDEGAVSGEPFLTPHQPVRRDDEEAMLVDSTGQGSNVDPVPTTYNGVLPDVVISPGNPPQPTPYPTQQMTFEDTSLPSFDIAAEVSWNYPRFASQANEWLLREVASPRILEAPQSTQSYPHPVIGHAYNTTSSSIAHSLGIWHQPPAHPSYVQPSTYNAPPLPEVAVDSYADQNDLSRTIEAHNSSPIDTHSISSTTAVATPRDRFKDWSPAGDWHLQKVFRGHDSWVNRLAFSHNGKLLASGSEDCTVRVWNVETGETVPNPLKGHTGAVLSVAFSPDDRRIVSASDDRTVRIWDVQTGQLLQFEEHTRWIWSVAFSSDGSRVASSDDNHNISIWDVDSKRRIRHLEQSEHLVEAHFSSDDRFIAATRHGDLSIYDVESGKQVSTSLQAGSFGDLVWFGDCAMYTLIDKKIRRWSEDAFILDWRSALSPDRKWIACSYRGNIYLYSRDPSPEELASVDIIVEKRHFTLVEDD